MNQGLYLSAAGALTNLHRQDVYAHNLAHMHTVGYKPDVVYTRERVSPAAAAIEAGMHPGAPLADSHRMLEQLSGTRVSPTRVDLSQGELVKTGSDLDLAISGEGFFVVQSNRAGGPNDGDSIRLTRDGRFTLNARGELVLSSNGMRVLDANNRPIRLDSTAPVRIDSTGEITQNGEAVAQLQFVSPSDPATLKKAGDNLLRIDGGGRAGGRIPATGRILQGHLESSAVDPILTMNAMIGASKGLAANAALMQYHDHLMDQAVNTFGRVA